MIHRHRMRVYIEDTDAVGIVYHPNYLSFCSRARVEWLRELGFFYGQMHESGIGFPIISAQVDYKSPAYVDDELLIESKLIEAKRVSLVFSHKISRYNDGHTKLVCEAVIKLAYVGQNMKPERIPESLLTGLKGEKGG